jgi:hypothetical protein
MKKQSLDIRFPYLFSRCPSSTEEVGGSSNATDMYSGDIRHESTQVPTVLIFPWFSLFLPDDVRRAAAYKQAAATSSNISHRTQFLIQFGAE